MNNRFKVCLSCFLLVAIFFAASILSCNSRGKPLPGSAGVVSAATPEAAEAGLEILKAGGNAVDAAVAISFALAVSEPALSGLGGQMQILFSAPGKEPVLINGTSFSPKDTQKDASSEDLTGHKATTVPFLNPDGSVSPEGSVWKQLLLGKTLRRLAEAGADDFYSGEIAREIAADMKANGGWITLEDLQNVPQPAEQKPLKGTYRSWDVFTMPPPGGGWVVLQILNILENYPSRELTPESSERLFHLVEALQIGHQNRRDYPVENLADYESEVAEKISKETAEQLFKDRERDGSGETTHFSVVDANGMVVSVSASINNYYGAKSAHPTLGFLYNDYMHEFKTGNPDHPFALRPGGMEQ